ncbi:MAG TPA: tetratricopeptide repeat protein [Kiloniellaceae bacterium]|nr:tetratricopeptide repeat protein [Kiloniellaceae bacterium]
MRKLYALVVLGVVVAPFAVMPPLAALADEKAVCDDALNAQKAGDLKKAVATYTTCLADPKLGSADQIIAHYNRGRAYAALRQDWNAIQDFTAVIKLQPDNADALYARGVLYQEGGNLGFAIQDYSTAIAHDGNYYQAYRARGIAYAEKGDAAFALQDLNQAVEIDDSAPESFNDRGYFYLSQGEDEKARKDFERALELKPDLTLARENLGHLSFFQGHYEDAVKSFQEAVKIDGKDAYAVIWLYLSQTRAKDKNAAAQLAKNAAALDLESWPGPVVSLLLGKTAPEAIAEMTKGGHRHVQKVQHAEGLFYLGEDKLLQGDAGAAKADFDAAVKTGMVGEIEVLAAGVELKRL